MNFESYKNKLPYPIKPGVAQCLQVNTHKMTLEEVLKQIDEWRECIILHYDLIDDCKKKRKAYDTENARIYKQFKEDLFKELGITGHPKAETLFQKAWEQGHSAGYEEVFNYASDLVDLLV